MVCRCALIAPLDRPVVPEVNRMSATSSGPTTGRSRAGRGPPARSPARVTTRSVTPGVGELADLVAAEEPVVDDDQRGAAVRSTTSATSGPT